MIGIAELLIGFWAAAYFGRSVILLVAWVGARALLRGITEILLAFKLRGVKRVPRRRVVLDQRDERREASPRPRRFAPETRS